MELRLRLCLMMCSARFSKIPGYWLCGIKDVGKLDQLSADVIEVLTHPPHRPTHPPPRDILPRRGDLEKLHILLFSLGCPLLEWRPPQDSFGAEADESDGGLHGSPCHGEMATDTNKGN